MRWPPTPGGKWRDYILHHPSRYYPGHMNAPASQSINTTLSLDKSHWDRTPAITGFYHLAQHGHEPILVRVASSTWPITDRMRIPVAFVAVTEAQDLSQRLAAGARFDVLELADGACIARGEVLPNDVRRDVSWTTFLAVSAGFLALHVMSALIFGLALTSGLRAFAGCALFTLIIALLSEITVKGRIGLSAYYLEKWFRVRRTQTEGHPSFPDGKQAYLRLQTLVVLALMSMLVFYFQFLAHAAGA